MNIGKENETQEFKESLAQLDKGLLSLTAMLNRHNKATVYFGVNDNGDVIGINATDKSLMKIREKISNKIQPKIVPQIELLNDNKIKYIKITAQESQTPYSYDGRYYIRNQSANEQADQITIKKMFTTSQADLLKQKKSPLQ